MGRRKCVWDSRCVVVVVEGKKGQVGRWRGALPLYLRWARLASPLENLREFTANLPYVRPDELHTMIRPF